MATGALDPELLRCCVSAWSVAQIAAFQRVAHKFAAERQFKFAVVCTDLRCADSHAMQQFLARHRGVAGNPIDGSTCTAEAEGSPSMLRTKHVLWLIWRPSHRQRSTLCPGPNPPAAVANALAAVQSGSAPGWAAAVHVLESTREECFRSAENALEAALSGSGDWEAAESAFAV